MTMKKQLFLFLLMLLPMVAMADVSGSCGTNVTYTYVESTHTLTISGSGAMANYTYDNHSSWYSYASGIVKAVIEDGVTSIGDEVFTGCSGLTSVTIPNSVISIGVYAFFGCSGLISVICLAENVPTTGSKAFISSSIKNTTLYVPAESVAAYQAAAPWSGFGQIKGVNEATLQVDNGQWAKDNRQRMMDNEFHDLQGRWVAKPSKGLYIVNGRKIVVK